MNYKHRCKCCQQGITKQEVQEYDGACASCYTAAQPDREATFTVFEKRAIVNMVYSQMEMIQVDNGTSIAGAFDMVELRDVSEDLPALRKHLGKRLEPEMKCRVILEARAAQLFKQHKAAPVAAICAPLDNYPELSIPAELIREARRPAVKIPIYGVMVCGEWHQTTRKEMLSCAQHVRKVKMVWTRPQAEEMPGLNAGRFCEPDAEVECYEEGVF